MSPLVVKDRQRVIQAALNAAKAKTGKFVRFVKLSDGSVTQSEITEEILNQVLIIRFEELAVKNEGRIKAEKMLSQHYSECINPKTRELTAMGIGFMDAVVDGWLLEVKSAARKA
ncbi:hypothetical protein ACEF96_004407 [Salmonella enterica]|nr:hypothetical protein [Salmonella enterica]